MYLGPSAPITQLYVSGFTLHGPLPSVQRGVFGGAAGDGWRGGKTKAVQGAGAGRAAGVLRGEALGFWGSACTFWAQGCPVSHPVTWDILQQDTKSPLGACKNVPCVEMNIPVERREPLFLFERSLV